MQHLFVPDHEVNMKKTAILALMLFITGLLSAELVWPEPLTVISFDNIDYYGDGLLTHDGLHLLAWEDLSSGNMEYRVRLYDQLYQPLWAEPLGLNKLFRIYDIVETSDSCFVVLLANNDGLRAFKISRAGTFLWSAQGAAVTANYLPMYTTEITPDLQGGVYISWVSSETHDFEIGMQHISANGNQTMPSSLPFLSDYQNCGSTDLLLQPDNSVILAWSAEYAIKMTRVGAAGQTLWTQPVSIDLSTTFIRIELCAFQDGSFAICTGHFTSVDMRRYNTSGTALWPDAVTAFTQSEINKFSLTAKLSSDNAILVMADTYNNEYLQKININGEVQFPGGISLKNGNNNIAYASDIVPDDQGGCVVIVSSSESYTNYTLKAIKITSSGAISFHPFSNDAWRMENVTANSFGNRIYIEWQAFLEGECGIRSQILNSDLSPCYSEIGYAVQCGSSGKLEYYNVSARETGVAVVYRKAYQNTEWWSLCLQIYNHAGQPQYTPPGLLLNNPESSVPAGMSILSSGDNTLIKWEQTLNGVNSTHIQIVDANYNLLFPNGGTIVRDGSCTNVACHLGEWYILWTEGNTGWAQKIVGNQFQWGNGLQLVPENPLYPSNLSSYFVNWPWVIWAVDSHWFVKRIDSSGSTIPGFAEAGAEVLCIDGDANLSNIRYRAVGENLHVSMSYSALDPYGEPIGFYKHAFLDSLGSCISGPTLVDVAWNYYCFTRNGELNLAWLEDRFLLKKYSSSGQLLMEDDFYIPAYLTGALSDIYSAQVLSDGNIMLLVGSYYDGAQRLNHLFINPSDGAVIPDDHFVYSSGGLYPVIAAINDKAWITWAKGDYNYDTMIQLQGVRLEGSPATDDHQIAPYAPHLDCCRPNPFNPTTTIDFSVPQACKARLCIYDLRGRKIRTLLDEELLSGKHSVVWDGKDDDGLISASGIYFIRLDAGEMHHVRKVSLVK